METLESVLSLPDPEIVNRILNDDHLAKLLSDLQLEVYQDDTLRDVREALMNEAIDHASVDCPWEEEWTIEDRRKHRETTYPLAFDQKTVVDLRARVLAKVRCAIKTVSEENYDDDTQLQNLLQRTHDGDLAYRYGETDRDGEGHIAGEYTRNVLFKWGLNFSPELQRLLAQNYKPEAWDHDAFILGVLAQEDRFTPKAWKVLIERDDKETYRAVWNTKTQNPAILALILGNGKLALLYRARTEKSARKELLTRSSEFHDADFRTWIKSRED